MGNCCANCRSKRNSGSARQVAPSPAAAAADPDGEGDPTVAPPPTVVVVGPEGEGDKLEREDPKLLARRRYREVDGLLDVFRSGSIALLRGSWLMQRAGYELPPSDLDDDRRVGCFCDRLGLRELEASQTLPHRQQLEADDPSAYLPFEELASMCKATKEGYPLPVVAVSYCWEGPHHPDPAGRLLLKIAKMLHEKLKEVGPLYHLKHTELGIFLDWASIFQKPRSPEQDVWFKNALRGMNVVYAHALTVPLIVEGQDAFLEHPRSVRGWPCFEEAMSFLLKDSRYVLGGRQGAPMPSAEFASMLESMVFTNGADRAMVADLYKRGLTEAFGGRSTLKFAGTGEEAGALGRCLQEAEETSLETVQISFSEGGAETPGDDLFVALLHSPKLRSLDLSSAKDLSENIWSLQSLTSLKLSNCPLAELADGIGRLSSLEELALRSCSGLKKLPTSIGQLTQLKTLLLRNCQGLEELPESIGGLQSLTSLDLTDCCGLRELPEGVGRLSALGHLNLRSCNLLKAVPESVGQLQQLKKLDMTGCSSVEALPEGVGRLSALEQLILESCRGLKTLPASMDQLRQLKMLEMEKCSSVEELPESIGHLAALEHLSLNGCALLKTVPESIGQLLQLKGLDMQKCSTLEELPEGIGRLSALEHLNLRNCTNLKGLPASVGQLPRLTKLNMEKCSGVEDLPGGFEAVTKLDLRGCPAGGCFKNPRPENLELLV